MEYLDLYNYLKNKVNYEEDLIRLDSGVRVCNFGFSSQNSYLLPGNVEHFCKAHGKIEEDDYSFINSKANQSRVLNVEDALVADNKYFRYSVFMPSGTDRAKDVILFFHGLNEKYWIKYLTWAYFLCTYTGKAVVLFPIAFHMNRAPHEWSNRHIMQHVCEQRKGLYPQLLHSTISNVAISTRLHAQPQRFFWSGFQTYYDIIQLVEDIRADRHAVICKDAGIDIFSYSIGCLLSEIFLMTDYKNYFNRSKLCMFCGGPTFNRMSPVSKFILDSEADVALYSYVVEHLESHLRQDAKLRHFLGPLHPEGQNFKMMLSYKDGIKQREEIFRSLSRRIFAVGLSQDTVIPPYEIVDTLQGRKRDIPIEVETMDFPYEYRHEDPFPLKNKISGELNESFERVFTRFGDFLLQ